MAAVTPGVNDAVWLLMGWIEHYLDDCGGGMFEDDLIVRTAAYLGEHCPDLLRAKFKELREEHEATLATLRTAGAVYADTGGSV